MTIAAGVLKTNPAEPAATRALLQALDLDPREAAALLGIPERDMALLVAGHAHVAGAAGKWDGRAECWRGAWCEMAGRLCSAVAAARAGKAA